ncbi:MAG: arylesterase [Thiobacillaceae bacterium]
MHIFLVWLFSLLVVPVAAASGGSILVLGDSLSAAYGLPRQSGWVTLLEERLSQRKFNYRVVNASVSGETSAGGASRIAGLLRQHRPEILILALGANDGLRGLPATQLQSNLETMIHTARRGNVKVLLVGMRMPPNFGPAYTRQFAAVYAELARRHRTAFVPFLLEGFADRPEYFLSDGIHPNGAAQPLILERVWTALEPLLHR